MITALQNKSFLGPPTRSSIRRDKMIVIPSMMANNGDTVSFGSSAFPLKANGDTAQMLSKVEKLYNQITSIPRQNI